VPPPTEMWPEACSTMSCTFRCWPILVTMKMERADEEGWQDEKKALNNTSFVIFYVSSASSKNELTDDKSKGTKLVMFMTKTTQSNFIGWQAALTLLSQPSISYT
jgi:hypothetical protein